MTPKKCCQPSYGDPSLASHHAVAHFVLKSVRTRGAHMSTNRLSSEKSPYLLQHAHNPVDWYPWGEEAFQKARNEDKPIFLSIGYSTCHWCHVMEHESFEDAETAAAMNQSFVSIKVDREERPDLDNIYMTVCQMMTGGGGWPLNVVLTPDLKPFFAGTYFPKTSRFGKIGMLELAARIREIWQTRRKDVLESADKVTNALRQMPDASSGSVQGKALLEQAFTELEKRFDAARGGFSPAPKFPTPHNLLFLLRYWKRTGDEKALKMVEKTLNALRLGGIYDHVGFGFHRYSTDAEWLVPHFEKMLYDQALLIMAYTEAYQVTGNEFYADTAKEIIAYVLRDMTSPRGGFYSAEDADSEGVEGKFYVWTLREIQDVLGQKDAALFSAVYSLEPEGNFHDEATGTPTGANIPHLLARLEEIAASRDMAPHELHDRLSIIREKLFSTREKRVHPHKDDKILTDWNGLMIAALAKAAQVFENREYGKAARKAADFLLSTLRDEQGRLLHRFRDGEAGLTAHVDDFAFFIWGLIELYETVFEPQYLAAALELNDDLLKRFWDIERGGFYFTAIDAENLLVRTKEVYDGAVPSGNAVSLLNLLRLGRMTSNPELESKAEEILKAFAGTLRQFPSAYTQMLVGLEFAEGRTYEVVIADSGADDLSPMLRIIRSNFLPNKVVLMRFRDGKHDNLLRVVRFDNDFVPLQNKTTAYVCVNYHCELPTTDPSRVLELLTA